MERSEKIKKLKRLRDHSPFENERDTAHLALLRLGFREKSVKVQA